MGAAEVKNGLTREQLLTRGDLEDFKIEIIDAIQQLLEKIEVKPPKKWLKSYEVRQLLNISPGTLQHLRINGTLPYAGMGHSILYDMDRINQFLGSQKSNQIR